MLVDVKPHKQYEAARYLDSEGIEYNIIPETGVLVFDVDSNDDDVLDKLNEINVG